jgi:purine catabolism regulator
VAHLTLRDVLVMPVIRNAGATVLAGEQALDRQVRWVHASELADIAPLLRGGDLVLTTGIALADDADGHREFARSLAEAEAAGLMIELGRRWDVVPQALIDAFAGHSLPLITLGREVRFAAITQAVGERVIDEQLAELRDAERVHDTFTELSLAEAEPAQILEAVQRLSGATVVIESEQHRVLDYLSGPDDVSDFLDGWQKRSRQVELVGRTVWNAEHGWLVTRLGRRDRGWGRLILQSPAPPGQRLVALVERAAAALALHRLHDRDRDNLVRRTHHELLTALLADPTATDLLRRCQLAGFPTSRRKFIGLTVRLELAAPPGIRPILDEVLAAVVHAANEVRAPALVCEMDRDIRLLLSIPPGASEIDVVDRLAARVTRIHPVLIGAGRAVPDHSWIDRTLREAQQVAESVRSRDAGRPVHRLEDVHLRGLLTLFGDDDRLRLFVVRELDALKAHDAQAQDDLMAALRAFLEHPASKSEAAASLHLSRPAFYARLARIESVLGLRLDDPDLRASLHVALLADDLLPRQQL